MMNATLRGKPDAGNPHVRFDEGEVASENPRRGSLLYKKLTILSLIVLSVSLGMRANAKEAVLVQDRPNYKAGCMTDWTPFALTVCGPVGLPWGNWDIKGLQIGIFNSVYQFSGLQIGGVNIADRAYGVQIGVINVITSNDVPFLPIVNWCW